MLRLKVESGPSPSSGLQPMGAAFVDPVEDRSGGEDVPMVVDEDDDLASPWVLILVPPPMDPSRLLGVDETAGRYWRTTWMKIASQARPRTSAPRPEEDGLC